MDASCSAPAGDNARRNRSRVDVAGEVPGMRRTTRLLMRCFAPLRMIVPRVVHLSMLFFSFFMDIHGQPRQCCRYGISRGVESRRLHLRLLRKSLTSVNAEYERSIHSYEVCPRVGTALKRKTPASGRLRTFRAHSRIREFTKF